MSSTGFIEITTGKILGSVPKALNSTWLKVWLPVLLDLLIDNNLVLMKPPWLMDSGNVVSCNNALATPSCIKWMKKTLYSFGLPVRHTLLLPFLLVPSLHSILKVWTTAMRKPWILISTRVSVWTQSWIWNTTICCLISYLCSVSMRMPSLLNWFLFINKWMNKTPISWRRNWINTCKPSFINYNKLGRTCSWAWLLVMISTVKMAMRNGG